MNSNSIDWTQLPRIIVPAAIFIAVLLYLFLRRIVVQLLQLWQQDQASRKAQELRNRSKQVSTQSAPVITRKTDLLANLGKQDKKLHAYAEHLVLNKQIAEAARIFESIKFQRRAIDLLESNGMIGEAAAVLMRMNLPNRAGVLFERNNRLKEAADHFLLAGEQAAAARVFSKLSQGNFRFLKQAAESYFLAGMQDQSLVCYRKLAMPSEVLRICLNAQKFEFLTDFLQTPAYVKEVLPKLDQVQMRQFVERLELNPHQTILMALWVSCFLRIDLIVAILRKLCDDQDCRQIFWKQLSSRTLSLICQVFAKHPMELDSEHYRLHAHSMLKAGHSEQGGYFSQLAEYREKSQANKSA